MADGARHLGKFAGASAGGQLRDGTINAFDPTSGALLGTLSTADGTRSWSTACGA